MKENRSNAPLITGLVASLVIHFALLLPVLMFVMTAPAAPRLRQARFDRENFRKPASQEEQEPEEESERLGIDEPTPSSLTWVGYDEYQEHIARLAEVDQAAFTENPATPQQPTQPTQPTPEVPPTPDQQQPVETERPTEDPQQPPPRSEDVEERPEPPSGSARVLEPENLQPVTPPDETSTVPLDEEERPLGETATATPTEEEPVRSAQPPVEEPADSPEEEARPTERPTEQPAEQPKEQPAEQPTEQPVQQPAQPQEPAPAQPAANPDAPPEPGDPADKESDPTSIIDAPPENWKAGKPLAAHGLELKPRRPAFTALQSLTIAPGNPVVEIRFGRDGRPLLAKIVTSSGDRLADQSIISSLYRWRATGARLKELKGEETANVRLRIVLGGRR